MPNKYKFGGNEEQTELALSTIDWGWRQYDPVIARWNVVDQWAEKYHTSSPYAFVMDNPVNRREIDGRYFVGKNGEEVELSTRKNGTIKVSHNATRDLKRLVRMVNSSGSQTAIGQIMKAGQNDTKIHVKVEKQVQGPIGSFGPSVYGRHQAHDQDGNALTYDKDKGDFNGAPAYVDGKEGVYKEATITVFQKNIKESMKMLGRKFGSITFSQEMANTFQHESNHRAKG